jgi:hypothetical protein
MPKIATLITAATLGCAAIAVQAATHSQNTTARSAQVQPAAVEALEKMSAYLHTVPAFLVTVQTQSNDVDAYGQLITLNGNATYKVRRPNAFSVDLALPNLAGQYVYDGKTMSVYDAKANYYTRFPTPSTIGPTLALAEQKYGATVPLVDLFNWSAGDDHAKALTSAHFVGKSKVEGQSTNHYAFRQPGKDWEIWIADGAKPLPVRLTIVTRNDPAKPQFQADFAWNTAPQFAPGAFAFTPPPNVPAKSVNPIQ